MVFVVAETSYRAPNFALDRDSLLVNPAGGLRVQGWMAGTNREPKTSERVRTPRTNILVAGRLGRRHRI